MKSCNRFFAQQIRYICFSQLIKETLREVYQFLFAAKNHLKRYFS